ncbi:Single-stranded-DNA-specific exonuclease RecJ [Polystyrenella longa]|uniref:Single-stranded-DNA-specific exonuclease RecJ n=1 Tax=Polystyrenella longa TaxID=2528007 RepID=A0A518CTY8_9PLAN|nr:single-stranded-DNA-specific exonuclease RecJ [Polystyrenella longa]QDU82699.1 Single-stranded-DNA-specific exonuclease RecJ [Polystyrenella longa]
MAQVLIARGYDSTAQVQEFLEAKLVDLHPPEQVPGLNKATELIFAAIEAERRITIYGDYDADGVCATSILWHCLKLLGAHVDYFIPSRLEEGYGLNKNAIRELHEADPERLLISVDCGITSVEEAALAKELGLELIITDHHQFADELPDAAAIVHPRLPGTEYPFGDLCGAAVAFKLAWRICQIKGDGKRATPRMREFLLSAMGLAALATITDVVPLHGENRLLVRFGLPALSERPGFGMKALLTVCELQEKKLLETDDIGFSIGPRINAAGRLGQARLAVELLTTENPERARELANYLNEMNEMRKKVERKILKQARELVDEEPEWLEAPALVLSSTEWHPGVIGIVASRVAEHYSKPTILIAMSEKEQVGQGSGRTIPNINLHAALAGSAEHLVKFGGHQAAAGMKIEADQIDDFRVSFCNQIQKQLEGDRPDEELWIDAEVRLADCTYGAVRELDRLGPFGEKNPRPTFSASRVQLAEPPRKMGQGERHLSLTLHQHGKRIKAIAFGKSDWADEIARIDGALSISFAVNINTFRGQSSVQLLLKDWKAEEAS